MFLERMNIKAKPHPIKIDLLAVINQTPPPPKTKEEAEGSAKGKGKSTEKAEAGLTESGGETE